MFELYHTELHLYGPADTETAEHRIVSTYYYRNYWTYIFSSIFLTKYEVWRESGF